MLQQEIRLGRKAIKIGHSFYITIPKQLITSGVIDTKQPIDTFALIPQIEDEE